MTHYRLGIDVGGTFTDAFLFDDETRSLTFHKVTSSGEEPSQPVLDAIKALSDTAEISPESVRVFVHGTTLALNTIVQRAGTTLGLLVTKGFRDLLELGRGRLPEIHNFFVQPTASLVRRDRVEEIDERLYADGRIRVPLDLDEVEQKARGLLHRGARALVICFLHSYANSQHEEMALQHLENVFPDVPVYASHRIWPEAREYERAMAAVLNAYVAGPMKSYYDKLQSGLARTGMKAAVYVSRSAGGIMTLGSAAAKPVETLLSGPSAGVLGAAHIAGAAGETKIICFDMGGTTTDVSVVDGQPRYVYESEIAGFQLTLPSIDIESIGAGGGSVAWVDPAGILRVGPRSAGAVPGPAAYGRGGSEPTVTDAYVALGYIHPDRFLGGQIPLETRKAREALSNLGRRTGESVEDLAWQIVTVATANMYAQLVPLLSRQGVDASEFTLVPYGGAGPTHAFFLAQETAIARLLIPPTPGGVSALGSLISDIRADFVRTLCGRLERLPEDAVTNAFRALEKEALNWLSGEQVPVVDQYCLRSADMRYVGQSFEVNVPLGESTSRDSMLEAFHRHHNIVYGHSDPDAPVEIVNIRVQVVGVMAAPEPMANGAAAPSKPSEERRDVRLGEQTFNVPIYQRTQLPNGFEALGPMVIEQYDSTVVVPSGWRIWQDERHNLRGEFLGG